ncbi:MAG: PAS domain S-box protein [Deltaproteobacteria bacterium]
MFLTRDKDSPVNSIMLAVLCTVLIIVGFFLEVPGHISLRVDIFNRVVSCFAVWFLAAVIERSKKEERVRDEILKARAKIEERLRERENTLSSIFRTVPVGIGMIRNRRLEFANESLRRLTGYSSQELEGQSTRKLYPSEHDYLEAGRIYQSLKTQFVASIESKWRRKNGEIFDMLLVLSPQKGEHGEVEFVFSAQDITERKKAARELERQRKMFETLTEYSPDVIFILDKDMRYRYINTASEKLTGVPRQKMIGKTSKELGLPEKSRLLWEQCFRDAIKRRRACFMESEYPAPHGSRTMINANVPLFKANGELDIVLGFSHDITDLKNTQLALERRAKETEEGNSILRALMENVPEGVIIADAPDQKIRSMSRYGIEITGRSDQPVRGRSLLTIGRQLFTPEGLPVSDEIKPMTRAIKEGHVIINQEYQLKAKNNLFIPVLINAAPIRDKEGKITGGVVVWKDITKLKQAEEVLRRDREAFERLVVERTRELISAQSELERAKRLSDIGELATTVAHELRNPLAGMKLALFSAKRKCQSENAEPHLDVIDLKISQASQIINNLLFYSRLKVPELHKVEPYRVIDEVAEGIKNRFHDFSLEEDLDAIKGKTMEADLTQLNELFTNVINNAHEAVREKHGTVRVSAHPSDGMIDFEVKDNGVGMDHEQLQKIFKPFYTTKSKGTGLGLTVSEQIVKLHGGSIGVSSEKGKGTTITIKLPLVHK